jgi:hypothetical protein
VTQADDDRQRRIGVNESLFREVNERMEDLARTFGEGSLADFICECGNSECTERLRLPLAEYEAVRAEPTRFVVANGHVVPEVERVVASSDLYTVVEKVEPDAARAATALDPRS